MLLARGARACDRRRIAVRAQADVGRALAQQQIERKQQHRGDDREHQAGPAPAVARDHDLQPRQQDDRSDADAGERDAEREPAPPHEPVRDELRLHAVAEEVRARADHDAERHVDLPRLARDRREAEAEHDHRDADLDHQDRTAPVHQPADERRDEGRDEEAEREDAGRDPAVELELVQHFGEQQRERGARIDAHRHRGEADRNDDPAVEDRQAREARTRLRGLARVRAVRSGRAGALAAWARPCRAASRRRRSRVRPPRAVPRGAPRRRCGSRRGNRASRSSGNGTRRSRAFRTAPSRRTVRNRRQASCACDSPNHRHSTGGGERRLARTCARPGSLPVSRRVPRVFAAERPLPLGARP